VNLRPRHPALFLVALLVAYALWYSLAGERREQTAVRGFRAPLTLVNIPRDLVITSSVPDSVSVQLRGPLSAVFASGAPLEVLLDLAEAQPGVQSFTISETTIQLPSQVEVVSIEPAEVTLELEQLERRTLPVRPIVDGSPALGFVVAGIRVAPARLTVQGPGSLLEALDEVETTALTIEGATEPVEATVEPRLPHPLLRSVTAVPLLVVVDVAPEPTPTPTPTPEPRQRRR
jgi:YbbR domain-containing protein